MAKRQQTSQKVLIETENFICENCGGTMTYDIKKGVFRCEACLVEQEIPVSSGEVKEYDFSKYHEREKTTVAFEGMAVVHCQNCGCEITFSNQEIATTCRMCGSSQVATVKQQSGIPPEGIIPFRIDKYDAQQAFKKWAKKRWFAPNDFKHRCAQGQLSGMYLPYWTYDAHVTGHYYGQGGKNHLVRDKDGKTHMEIRWFPVSGKVVQDFDDILIAATQREDEIKGILPFHTTRHTVPYSPSYLSGYHAELYTLKADEGFELAKEQIEQTMYVLAEQNIRRYYEHARVHTMQTAVEEVTYKYVLLPVWASQYGYKNKTYSYFINGETGKVAGSRPYSVPKILLAILLAVLMLLLALSAQENRKRDAFQTIKSSRDYVEQINYETYPRI